MNVKGFDLGGMEKAFDSDFTYSSRDISRLLGVTEETVRRWARNGELDCTYSSRKDGYSIKGSEIVKFLTDHPRYLVKGAESVEDVDGVDGGTVSYGSFAIKRLLEEIDISEKRITKLEGEIEKEKRSVEKNRSLLRGFLAGE